MCWFNDSIIVIRRQYRYPFLVLCGLATAGTCIGRVLLAEPSHSQPGQDGLVGGWQCPSFWHGQVAVSVPGVVGVGGLFLQVPWVGF